MKRYNPKDIEPRWQQTWDDEQVYKTDVKSSKPKYLAMSMFNYPSGNGIHIGHAMNYTISDVMARFKRQQGYESYHPVGWDSFGLPAENYAIKTGVSPQQSMATIIPSYHTQYRAMGWSNDWTKEIVTSSPEYYRWTQWIFSEMFKAGMAYQDARLQWWCTKCQTVLANEQVIDGKCWRHDTSDDLEVQKREVKQWFLKVTDYAEEMLDATPDLEWSEVVKTAQTNWIGKSQGAEVKFALAKETEAKDSLKFAPELADEIKAGKKWVTFRLESKNLAANDIADFFVRDGETVSPFGQAKITKVQSLSLRDIPNDLEGHKHYANDADKLEQQRSFYGEQVTLDTEFTIYEFEYIPSSITVFTTRPDTLYGATFLVLAPEHELVSQIVTDEQRSEIEAYVKDAARKSEVERQESKEKTGVFTGAYAANPANNELLPIWIADYVLTGYGTGAIMAVPAHDERDATFAEKYGLSIKQVVAGDYVDNDFPLHPEEEIIEREAVQMIIKHPKDETYLLLKMKGWDREGYSFVTGGLDGEAVDVAARRELLEETGYNDIESVTELPNIYFAAFYHEYKKENRRVQMHTVVVKLKSLAQDTVSEEEKALNESMWLGASEVAARILGSQPKRIFDEFLSGAASGHEEGVMTNSGKYDGMPSADAREKVVADLTARGLAEPKTNFRIRDWSVSRQRYWGAPIPIINCPDHGAVLDPNLPVILPELVDFQPSGDGRSALGRATDWLNVPCPTCGKPGQRETDTLDTYMCSSWYFLRYIDPHNDTEVFNSDLANKWMPVDFYNGGDHATAHMIYARFVTRFFWHQGLLNSPEPFKRFLFNGKVTASDGTMFSKSKGNGVDPLEIIAQGYGADALRTYLMFAAPLDLWVRWDPQGVPGTYRFLNRIWNLTQEFLEQKNERRKTNEDVSSEGSVLRIIHPAIKKVTADLEGQKYNTAIAAMMKATNDLYVLKAKDGFADQTAWQFTLESLVALVAPFAPHTADELWHDLGHESSAQRDSWPIFDEAYCVSDEVTYAVQVNGKIRGEVKIAAGSDQSQVETAARADERVAGYLAEGTVLKVIFVSGKLISFVVK